MANNKSCEHNCHKLREYVCYACALKETEKLLLEIGELKAEVKIMAKINSALWEMNQKQFNRLLEKCNGTL